MKTFDSQGDSRKLQIDPLNMCPPIGAIYAALGIHACLPHSHGASGCCRFQRMELSKHFQKIIRVTSSMLLESSAIFGGEENLRTAVNNAFQVYSPEVLAIHTTCLSETIGDDVGGIVKNLDVPASRRIVYASTPGYAGSPLTGYASMLEAIIRQIPARREKKIKKLLLLPGMLNPSDIGEVARYAGLFFDQLTVLPDVRGVLDWQTPRNVREYAPGGTPLAEIISLGACSDAIALGAEATAAGASALAELNITAAQLTVPVGIEATDRFIESLCRRSARKVPDSIKAERTRAVDVLMHLHPTLYHKKAAIFCDADLAVPLTEFLAGIGMLPVFVCTGFAQKAFMDSIRAIFERYHIDGIVLSQADRYDLEQFLRETPVDILIGGSRGKILSRKLGIPLLRFGFPVIDRPLEYLYPYTGYRGCLYLLQKILCTLQDFAEQDTLAEDLHIAESF